MLDHDSKESKSPLAIVVLKREKSTDTIDELLEPTNNNTIDESVNKESKAEAELASDSIDALIDSSE